MAHEPGAPLRVALLGCGVVGSAVATRLVENADDLAARVGRAARARRHRRAPPAATAPRRAGRPVAVHRRRRGARHPRRHRHRGDRRHRPRARPHPARHGARRLGGLGQQGTARRGRPDPLRRGRRRTTSTSTTRPRWPAPSRSCAPSASRSPATTCARCSASSTARRTSSSTRWTPRAPASPRPSRRPRRSGYAEADPTADVEGFDAAAKAAILASLAFHTRVSCADVHREGITEVTAGDIQAAT